MKEEKMNESNPSQSDDTLINPPVFYWFRRSDGKLCNHTKDVKRHIFDDKDNYLILQIPPIKKCCQIGRVQYFNAEVYNNVDYNLHFPRLGPWNYIQNEELVDNPLDPNEWGNYIKDLVLNVPFEITNKLTMQCTVKVKNSEFGSRGWGFWNTTTALKSNNTAWFIELVGNDDYPLNGLWAVTQNGLNMSMMKIVKFGKLDEEPHDYKIELYKDHVDFTIDDTVYTEHNKWCIPTLPMAVHIWVDNAVFSLSPFGIKHITHETHNKRINYIKNMSIHWE
jgi:hypothetical protein